MLLNYNNKTEDYIDRNSLEDSEVQG